MEVAPTKSAADEIAEKAKEQLAKLAKEMGIPTWALYCIGIGEREPLFHCKTIVDFQTETGSTVSTVCRTRSYGFEFNQRLNGPRRSVLHCFLLSRQPWV